VNGTRKPALLYVLAALTLLEAVGVAVVAIYLVVEIVAAPTASYGSAIALAVVVAIAAIALALLARGTVNGRPWIRGATVCVAVLQLLIAYSIVITKEPALGWVLAVPAVALLVLVFTPPVLKATIRPSRDREDGRTF
jgi:hypothetical protein